MSSESEQPPQLEVTAFPEAAIVGVRGFYSDWPVTQLTDLGGLPADPFILPKLVQNECGSASVSASGGVDGGGVAGSSGALISIVRKLI